MKVKCIKSSSDTSSGFTKDKYYPYEYISLDRFFTENNCGQRDNYPLNGCVWEFEIVKEEINNEYSIY